MTSKETKRKPEDRGTDSQSKESFLVLHNDPIHSFDYVINVLMEVCNHSFEQASQCTMITHYKGSCDIKKGLYKTLRPLKEALIKRELKATID
jgi:ATP-dependent Clp protease adaptor protein ClpS